MSHDELRKLYGKTHIFIIGSPATNIASRMINRWSLFRFHLDDTLNTFHDKLVSMKQLHDEDVFRAFLQLLGGAANSDPPDARSGPCLSQREMNDLAEATRVLLGTYRPADFPDRFRRVGLLDPLASEVMNLPTRMHNDFALVSLAVNPFAEDDQYVCVVAAGRRSRGTAHAVRALAEDSFAERPLGGIFKLELPDGREQRSWLFEDGRREFQTSPYSIAAMRSAFERALSGGAPPGGSLLASFAKDELTACINLIDSTA
jgi:hypothetical protein